MRLCISIIIFLPLLLNASLSLTAEEKQWIKEHPSVIVGGEMDWAPFDFVDKNNNYTGITNDYLKLISKKSGLEFKVVTGLTWAELVEKFKEREIDVLPAVFYSEERKKYGLYTKSYYSTSSFLFVQKDSGIKGFEDLKGKVLAIPKGYTVISTIKEKFPNINILETKTLLDGVHSVLNTEADASYEVQAVMAHTLKENAISGIKGIGQQTFGSTPLHMLVRNDSKILVSIINKSINDISKEEKDEIFHHWISLKVSQPIDFVLLAQIFSVFFLLIAFVGYRQYVLKKYNDELKKAKEEAEKANQSKTEFLAMVSHEIRTPMNAIIGFTDVIAKTSLNKTQTEYIHTINSSSKLLLEIINDILDFSKIESGKLEIECHAFNLHYLINDISNIFSELMHKKSIMFTSSNIENLPSCIKGDQVRLKQVIFNLLSNALKFTPEKGVIIFDIRYEKNSLHVSVSDNGVGIAQEKLGKIFEAFSQEDVSTTRKYGGTGLGLTISSKLVEGMGGKLQVTSSLGKGSLFFFDFPVEVCQNQINDNTQENESKTDFETLKAHVLIVEDNKTNQLLLGIILDELGVTYDIANDGVEGVSAYKEHRYDLIFMDENMPNLSGIEATQQIRALETEKKTPIIAVTANAMVEDRKRFIDAGMDDYLSKPYEEKDIQAIIIKTLYKGTAT